MAKTLHWKSELSSWRKNSKTYEWRCTVLRWNRNHQRAVSLSITEIIFLTRMHSSRMRTGRSLTVCWSLLPGGVWSRGGVCSGGGLAQGGLLQGGSRGVWPWGGCLLPGGISQHALRQTPPVDRQMPVKILPWPNFVAAGNEDPLLGTLF